MSTIFTVRELTASIKGSLEKNFPFVWVKGEVSNLARPSSGHVYFSLKDSDALLQCVWFKNAQRSEEKFDPLTGEVFEDGPRPSLAQSLKNGQEVLCAGHISVYAPRGSYQLTVSLMQEGGRGALYAAFEALKTKLLGLGYFESERKKQLPYNPKRIAVITSPKGAAIYDFLRIAQKGGTGSDIRIFPVPVQGEGAAPAIAAAVDMAVAQQWAEVIVLIRGGGSLEDLWAFNEEVVAKAIFHCPLPVLAGIGHEVDVSIADMTADVRAATPTHAAQLLWPARQELMQRVDSLEWSVQEAGMNLLQRFAQRLIHQEQALRWLSPVQAWQRKEELLRHKTARLAQCMEQQLTFKERELKHEEQSLPQISRRLEREASALQSLELRLNHAAQSLMSKKEQFFSAWEHSLPSLMRQQKEQKRHLLQNLTLQLEAMNPLAPLSRGYALMQKSDGALVRSVQDVKQGQEIHMHVADGHIAAIVQRTETSTKKR